MMKKLYVISMLMLALPFIGKAQVYIQNTMFNFNKFVYNPASAGASGYTNITSMLRTQWRGLPGGPTTFTLGCDAPIAKIRGAVGGYLINDKLGYLNTTGANLGYAFRMALGDIDANENVPTLSIGAQLGILQKSLNGNIILDQVGGTDPLIGQGNFSASTIVPNLGAGIYLNGPSDKYYVGVSAQDLLEPSLKGLLLSTATVKARVPRSFYVMGGYTFNLNDRMSLQPNVMVKTDGRATQFDVNAMLNIKPLVVGLGYRGLANAADLMGIVGVNISDRMFFGYSYDYALSGLQAGRDVHTHEIVLTYRFPQITPANNKHWNIFDK